jgi:hypothetical protein
LFFEDLLKSKETSPEIIVQILDAIKTILISGEEEEPNEDNSHGKANDILKTNEKKIVKKENLFLISITNTDLPNVLISLQNHENEKIYERVYEILQEYFDCELDEDK